MRILLADDDEGIREALATCLRLRGCEVVQCRDGQQAIREIDSSLTTKLSVFNCVVSDYQMPFKTGLDVANVCRNYDIPCVVMSGDESNGDRFKGTTTFFLRKPFQPKHLVEMIKRATGLYIET